ncbi:protein kinase domain-containing protein [Halothiobacillus sp. DCM-1]|uniref:serine/threonine-protein kinase n=1 Tax=Halothiobacillus sp. DCM-1 TaxID=3112558 RepID=UPI00324DF277
MAKAFGRFEIQGELGRGAMSIIYRGYDPKIERMLAIKTLRPEYSAHSEYRARFLTEAKAAGTLNHPHIVTIFDVGEVDGIPFIAMELLTGTSLSEYAAAHPDGMPLPVLLKVAIQIAEALDFAHRHGVVHQDIKPDNIVLLNEAHDIKMMDFGIARILSAEQAPSEEGARAFLSGTPQYMSPEQITDQPIDGRSDLYALGVLLFELISGHLPFEADDPWSLWQKTLKDPLPALKPRDPFTPPELLELVRTLLAKDPSARYQSASGLAADLKAMARRVEARDRHALAAKIIPLRVRWPLVMATVVALVMLLGLFWVQHKQNQTITELAYDYGFSLSEWVAVQTAEDLLLQDKPALQSWVDSMSHNREIVYMAIRNLNGQLEAQTRGDALAAQMASQLHPDHVTLARGDMKVYTVHGSDSAPFFVFEMPIEYQDKRVGQLQIGLATNALATANRTTLLTLLTWIVLVIGAVVAGTYWLTGRLNVPLDQVISALDQIKQGRLEHRIRRHRRDDFERLFAAYNAMADVLEARELRVRAAALDHKHDVPLGVEGRSLDEPHPAPGSGVIPR